MIHRTFALTIILAATISSAGQATMTDETLPPEPDDVTAFTLPAPDTPRGREYLAAFDAAIERLIPKLDPASGMVKIDPPDPIPEVDPSVAELDRHSRKGYINGGIHYYYRLGRGSAAGIGALGYAYFQPLSRYCGNDTVLGLIRAGFETFMANQAESGEFVFCPIRFSSVYGTHEMAWRLENFITAYFCVRDALEPAQRERYWRFLTRAMRFLQATVCDHACNRGMVWCSTMAMSWHATGDESFLADARDVFRRINPFVFHVSGQVNEGHGPDHVYSPISYAYLIRYRLMTGDESLDPIIRRSTDWMTEMYTDLTVPFLGLSTRYDAPNGGSKAFVRLAGYEMFIDDAPEYADLAVTLLDETLKRYPDRPIDHGGITWMIAARYHDPEAFASGRGAAREPWVHHYEDTSHEYYTVGQPGYRTMITLRSIRRRKGLQTWAARNADPLIFPERDRPSTTLAWGYDLAGRDVSGEEWHRYDAPNDATAIHSVSAQHGELVATYLFSPASVVVVQSMADPEDRETVFAGSERFIESFALADGRVESDSVPGSVVAWDGAFALDDDGLAARLRNDAATQAYALASGSFTPGALAVGNDGGITVGWTDTSGTYEAHINQGFGGEGLARGQALVRRVGE